MSAELMHAAALTPPPVWAQQPVAVLGMGRSGQAMAAFVARRGGRVLALDDRPVHLWYNATLASLPIWPRSAPFAAEELAGCSALLLSPGIDAQRHPLVAAARARRLAILGELELAGPLPCPLLAITGTNGKSTTTTLLGALLRGLDKEVFCGGNLGAPVVAWLDAPAQAARRSHYAVLELSSFQLETAAHLQAQVGVVLNVTADHLERYANFEAYAAAKARLVRAVPADGTVILNADDATVRAMAPLARGRVWWFSCREAPLPGPGVCLQGERLMAQGAALAPLQGVSLQQAHLWGLHNRANAMAAWLAAWALGLASQASQLLPAYQQYRGLAHRLQPVGQVRGVHYINDSKATNDAAAASAIDACATQLAPGAALVLLLGGQPKAGGYQQVLAACQRVALRAVGFFGAAVLPLQAAWQTARLAPQPSHHSSLEAACIAARAAAQPGDIVLLAPACASFDAFSDYAARGSAFAAWVQAAAVQA